MSSTNLVISRLQNQRSRIQGMLSPGRKQRQPGLSLNASISPVAPEFAGRKFQLAAKKMRTLDAAKIGQTLSSGLTSLGTDIHSKFEDIQKIIHINPGTSRQNNIWSSLETPLSEPQSARQETPDDPGVLRSGSIIQKMNMLPRPGQSLDSFKDQVQKQPRTTRPPLEKKPLIDKNTRRFSQVQEVTPGQKLVPPDMPAVPVKSDEAQPPQVKTKETSETATIQSQPDASVSVSDKSLITPRVEKPLPGPSKKTELPVPPAEPVQKSSPLDMPLRQEPRIPKPAARTEQPTPPEVKAQPSDAKLDQSANGKEDEIRVADAQVERSPGSQLPVQEEEILKALPVQKKTPVQEALKKALPVKKEQKQAPKPVARPGIQRRTDAPQASTRPVIQRQPGADVSRPAPDRPLIQRSPDGDIPAAAPARPAIKQTPQTTAPSARLPAPPTPAEPEAGTSEMPLRQNIDYRQNASRAIRAIAPDQMKPLSLPSLINRDDAPLLTRPKKQPVQREGSPAHQDAPFSSKQVQQASPASIPESLLMDTPYRVASQSLVTQNLEPIPMPLALPAAAGALKPELKPAIPPPQPSLEKLPRKKTGVAKTNNTIQRTWEGHSPPGQSASGDSGASSNASSEPIDLETLAENVFPYVKRILEIEVDRSSGKLR